MASLVNKLVKFARTPQGQRLTREAVAKARELANRPENRQKVVDLRRRVAEGANKRSGTR